MRRPLESGWALSTWPPAGRVTACPATTDTGFPLQSSATRCGSYHRFALSFRAVEDVLARRDVEVTYEAIRKWCRRFGPEYAGRLRRRRGRLGDTWHLDEVFVTIQGRQQYLWRAVDEDGDILDILVQPRRNRHAAVRFFRT